jgi:pimeloyl-ACP methyl ester carboxylesterase
MSHSPSHSSSSSSSSSSMAPSQAPSATPGILHHVAPVSAFEVAPSSTSASTPTNLLLWIGGLTDTYHSVSYVYTLASSLPPSWSLAQVNLSSAASGWGISSLSQDVAELSSLIHHFRTQGKEKVVIMGHSTGCQDCLHFFASPDKTGDRAKVDGVILQASVSDREAIAMDMPSSSLETANATAKEWCATGKGENILPLAITASNFGNNPVTARRWVSLACKGGEDDYFSSDLSDEQLSNTFGKVDVPLLLLYGEEDEYVPKYVDRKALVQRWIPFVKGRVDEQSRELLGGASHNLNGDEESVVEELVKRVGKFLDSI